MAFIETHDEPDISDEVRAMYARQAAHWGFVPNYAKVFCHRPEIMALWAQLQAGIKRHMDKRRFELVTFAAAHELLKHVVLAGTRQGADGDHSRAGRRRDCSGRYAHIAVASRGGDGRLCAGRRA